MKNKKGLVISTIFAFIIFGVSLPLFITNHKKIKADTINDLSNTTWIFNNSITSASGSRFYINFYLENNTSATYTSIYAPNTGTVLFYNGNNITNAYQAGAWNSLNYKNIVITGGDDVTNTSLISWLQTNATQPTPPTPTTEQITHRYWSPWGIIQMVDDQVVGDNDIEYTVLFNEQRRQYDETIQTGLIFKGLITTDDPSYSYIESIHEPGINILYKGESSNLNNTMWLEFNVGDYIDIDLYNFMDLQGYWFDDASAYIVGMNQGYVEGKAEGRSLGQADGVEYTNLISSIFNGVGDLLSIQVFPNITIALIIGLPLLLGVLIIIIKLLRG